MNTRLTPAAKAKAFEAIQAMHRACIGKAGITALTAKLTSKHESAAAHIYGLAVFAARKEEKLPKAVALFREMCRHAEAELKAKLEVANLKDAVPIWAVYKSNITRGMNLGISPLDHESEKAFRQAMAEAAAPTQDPVPSPALITDVERFLARDTTIADRLRDRLQRIVLEAQYVKHSKLAQAEEIFQDASERLAELLDHRSLPDHEPTRSFVVTGAAQVAATLQ